MIRWTFYPISGHYWPVVAAAAVLLVLLWVIGPARKKTNPLRRKLLAALRLAIVALVVFAMLRPTVVYTDTKKQSATLVFMLDNTRSMGVRDEINNRSRFEAEEKTIEGSSDALAEAARDFEVKAYAFGPVLRPLEVTKGRINLGNLQPDGDQTAIGSALEDMVREQAGKRLLAVLFLSDGAQRAYPPRDILPQTAAGHLKHLGFPLYTVRFGQIRALGQARDVAVSELVADQYVFVKNDLSIRGQIRIDGYTNQPIPVKLFVQAPEGKPQEVARQIVQATGDGDLAAVQFSYVPQVPGEHKITLQAEVQPGEIVTINNEVSTFVNVLKGGLKVLYVEGALRVEQTFLKRSLGASRDISVEYRRFDPRKPDVRPGDEGDWFKPGKYDVYILGDVDSSVFKEGELAALRDRVSKGAGLIMLGGFHSFGPGGYGQTPLRDVLPVQMGRLERQSGDGTIATDLQETNPVKMEPTQLGRMHFSLMLGATPGESAALWAQLPPLDGANKLREAPTARILAAGNDGLPLLVSQEFGDGRVMAFAGDSTWRWWMHGFDSAHKRFWRQVVLWLAKKDEANEGNVWVKFPQRRFSPGRVVEFTMGAQSPTGEAVKNANYQVEVELPNGTRQTLFPVRGEETTSASFRDTQQAGDYTVHVTATGPDSKAIGIAKARFTVFQQDLELDNPAADAGTLEDIAQTTGGQAVAPEDLPDLIRRLIRDTEHLDVQIEAKETFWDKWPFFLAMVGLLGAEWFLRKRWGLV